MAKISGDALRETGFMGLMLAIHLVLVYVLFLVLLYSKFMHSLYRFIALILYSVKRCGGLFIIDRGVAAGAGCFQLFAVIFFCVWRSFYAFHFGQ